VEKEDYFVEPNSKKSDFWWYFLGITILTLSVLGGSCIGVVTNFIPSTNTWVKNAWRAAIQVIYMIIPAIIELYVTWGQYNFRETITAKRVGIIFAAIFM